MSIKRSIFAVAASFAMVVGAFAQSVPLPSALPLSQNDYVQIIQDGAPSAQSSYARAGIVAGSPIYQNLGTITTGNTFAVNAGVSNVFAQAAGTLAAVTLTAPANPSDGTRLCFISNQITTALTLSANTGQTVTAGGTALGAAHTPLCWTYVLASATWY